MNFQQSLETHFPGALSEEAFIRASQEALAAYGFHRENTIACVAVCRDEMTRTLVDGVQAAWGEAFNFSSLGGMLFLGKTGFLAAQHHAPLYGGRERYVFFAMPHIAIDAQGEVGVCYRPGRQEPSGACGALLAFRREMLSGRLNLELDLDDVEQSLLKHRLLRRIRYGNVPDLVSLTRIAHEVIREDLERLLAATVDAAQSDYAVLTGIQVHGPDRAQYVWPGEMYAVVGGRKTRLAFEDKKRFAEVLPGE